MLKLFFLTQLEALILYVCAFSLATAFCYFVIDFSTIKDSLILIAKFFFPTFVLYGVVLFRQSLSIKSSKELKCKSLLKTYERKS